METMHTDSHFDFTSFISQHVTCVMHIFYTCPWKRLDWDIERKKKGKNTDIHGSNCSHMGTSLHTAQRLSNQPNCVFDV